MNQKKIVYFTCPEIKDLKYITQVKRIKKAIKVLGLKVIGSPAQKNTEVYYSDIEKVIRKSDAMVVELSYPSARIGYEIAYALMQQKPVLVLYREGNDGAVKSFALKKGYKSLHVKQYDNNVDSIIKQFLNKISKDLFVKRLPIEFTQAQLDYIQDMQKKWKKKSFNATLRELIDKNME